MFTIYQIAFVKDRRTDRDLDKIKCYRPITLGTLRNHDGKGNGKVKKQ